MMNEAAIRAYCLVKKGAREDYPFGPDVTVYKTGSKIFLLVSNRNGGVKMSFKDHPHLNYEWRDQYSAVQPGYHLNKLHWNTLAIDGTVPDADIQRMIDHSHEIVFRSLSRNAKRTESK